MNKMRSLFFIAILIIIIFLLVIIVGFQAFNVLENFNDCYEMGYDYYEAVGSNYNNQNINCCKSEAKLENGKWVLKKICKALDK